MTPALRNNLVVLALVLSAGVAMCRSSRQAEAWGARAREHATAYAAELYGAGTEVGPCDRATTTIWVCLVPAETALIECDGASQMCEVRP